MDNGIPMKRNWHSKVDAMPNIPRSKDGFIESLKIILRALDDNMPITTIINIPGSDSENKLEDYLIRLRPMGFVYNNNLNWKLSKESRRWLETGSIEYLGLMLNNSIKFFSEILFILTQKGKSQIKDIRIIADKEYLLSWKTKDQIRSRLRWLRDLNFIKYNELSYEYSITQGGENFLNKYGYEKSEEIQIIIDNTEDEKYLDASDWAKDFFMEHLEGTQKKNSVGYIPGHKSEIYDVVIGYLLQIGQSMTTEYIQEYSRSNFKISSNSLRHFLGTLNYLELVERVSKESYQVTDVGLNLLKTSSQIDFVLLIASKYTFVSELMLLLEKEAMTAKELAIEAKINYGFPNDKTNYVSKRLHILENAEFIKETSKRKYELTKRGKIFCNDYKEFFDINHFDDKKSKIYDNDKKSNISIFSELRAFSMDSANPNNFEKAIQKAFEILGFKSNWLGGSGKTDVLIEAPTSPNFSYKVAIDAKANYSGNVTEGLVNFDTINEHKKKHNANFSMIIGYNFQGERLIRRAEEHKIALCTVDDLENLIKMHYEVPLKSNSYRKIFEQCGLINLGSLKEDRYKIVREGNLLKDTMKYLYSLVDDSEFNGIVNPQIVYAMLKMKGTYNPTASVNEIRDILEFLSSPIIGCVGKNKDSYYALGSLEDASKTFEFLLKAINEN